MTDTLRRFTPTPEYARYVVTLMRTIYDEDQGRVEVHVTAIGPASAKQLAIETVRDLYPDAFALRAELECPGCKHDAHLHRCIAAGCGCNERTVVVV